MKKAIVNNLGLKLLSVAIAILFWFFVINLSDYSMTVRIKDIPVQEQNGDALDALDKVYDIASGDKVDIIVKGRRSVVSKLDANDFVATADLSTMSITNTVQIFVEPKNKSLTDEINITCVDNTMKLNLEEKVSVKMPVKVLTKGNTAEGYYACVLEAKPNMITVEGPKSAVERVTEVRTEVSVDKLKKDAKLEGVLALVDAYGDEIANDKLVLERKKVNVSVKVYPIKVVPVSIQTTGVPAKGYDVAKVEYQPKTISIAGPESVLEYVKEIKLNNISVSGVSSSIETTINILDYLPDGVYLAQDSNEVAVSITIDKLETKTFYPKVSDITLTGKKSDFKYTVKLSSNFRIDVSGLGVEIEELKLEDLAPTISLSNILPGTNYNVSLQLKDKEGCTYTIIGTVEIVAEN